MAQAQTIRTSFTDKVGIAHPIVQAPMGGPSCPELAAAVSEAGGLGMLAVSRDADATIAEKVERTARLTGKPFGVNLILEWDQRHRLEFILSQPVRIVSFSWGISRPLIEMAKQAGAIVVQAVPSSLAMRTALEAGADVIVAQGWEAGGHVEGNVATLPLVRACVRACPEVPILGAGGISDGAGLAAILALGGAGAWMGTRFLTAHEADVHPTYLEHVLSADENSTVHTGLFDGDWPNAPHRVLRSEAVQLWERAGFPPSGSRPLEGTVVANRGDGTPVYRYASYSARRDTTGDIESVPLWAGQSVYGAQRRQPAAEIVAEIVADARKSLVVASGSVIRSRKQ